MSEGNRILEVLVWYRAFELVNFLNDTHFDFGYGFQISTSRYVWYLLPCMVSIKCFNQILTPISDLFSSKLSQDSYQKELGVKYTKGFLEKKYAKALIFCGEKVRSCLIWTVSSWSLLIEQKGMQKKTFTLLVTSSQIWLIPPVDGHQSTYLTKLEKKNPDNDIRQCMYCSNTKIV
jgi:hypothetical protein